MGCDDLRRLARIEECVPLAWAGTSEADRPVNLGDALSPVMTALMSGRPVRRVPFRSHTPRLCAVGTVAQDLALGEAWIWGAGCDARRMTAAGRRRFSPDPALRAHVCATRGPLSAIRLGGGRLATEVFGDPVWLLPRFYAPQIDKRWEIGVILHLTELTDRTPVCRPRPELSRYAVPPEFDGAVRLINTVTEPTPAAMRGRLDEILACRRILSTSLHGLVFAESYGIPCLYFPTFAETGPGEAALGEGSPVDHRMNDLYMGLGRDRLAYLSQPHGAPTDWAAAMAAIDAAWRPATADMDALTAAFPLDLAPLTPRPGETIWEHPVLNAFPYAHDGSTLRRADRDASGAVRAAAASRRRVQAARLQGLGLSTVIGPPPAPPRLRLLRRGVGPARIPLVWASAPASEPDINLGDALSPVIVAAISGLPIFACGRDSKVARMAAVGTIAHDLAGGEAHLWGPGLDASRNRARPGAPYAPPPDTTLHVHAMRGPFSADVLRRHGVAAPEIFGDPVYLLDRLFPLESVEKTHDLGVIVHLSEFAPRPASPPSGVWTRLKRRAGLGAPPPRRLRSEHVRYAIPEAFRDRVRIIDMFCARNLDAMRAKLIEIASCRAILSTSLHGLVIADVYGAPNAWFGFGPGGLRHVDPMNPAHQLDHRMRDLYAGQARDRVPVVYTPRDKPSDWDRLIEWSAAFEVHKPDVTPLLNAFPGPLAVEPDASSWPLPRGLVPGLE